MSKIAILDTAVLPKYLHCQGFHVYNVCGCREKQNFLEHSHGTVCARVLDYFASDYELFCIQIMESKAEIRGKPMGEIRDLERGLRLCLELDVDIVCMSAVTSLLSDSSIIYSAAKKLAEKSILIAALDNKRFFSVPTVYPFVLGVQSDEDNILSPGELAYNDKDLFCAGLYVNCKIPLLEDFGSMPSNSYAVPVVAARINDWKNQGKDIGEEIQRLQSYPVHGMLEEVAIKRKLGIRRNLPLAVLYASDNENSYEVCQRAFDRLHADYGVQATALCSMALGVDVRFRTTEVLKELKNEVLFMEYCYKTDLIFLIIRKKERDEVMRQIDADLEIVLKEERVSILYEYFHEEGSADNLADLVYRILQ